MNKYVEEQRPDHLVQLCRDEHRHYTFVEYTHEVSIADARDGFEWWFPYANGLGCGSVIHKATLSHGVNVLGNGHIFLFLLAPNETTKNLIHEFRKVSGVERVTGEFIVPQGSRGVLEIVGAQEGDVFRVTYCMEVYPNDCQGVAL